MGQLFSSGEELRQARAAIGSLLYEAMLEGGAVPDIGVVHPLLLANHDERFDSGAYLQAQLKQVQLNIGSRAPAYLKDLIGRLSTFSDEPRLAGLLGLVVSMVMDMVYTSSKQPSSVKGKSAGSCQRVWKLQEVMEEYLKRCRINLSDKSKLIQDSMRLEAQLSLALTQLKTCLLSGDCDSRSLRHWASGAAFHAQMLVQLADLEGKEEPLTAKAALEQYKEDLTQIAPAYRLYKSRTVFVVKRRGGSFDASDENLDEGSMTGLAVTDREMGRSVAIPLAAMAMETGTRSASGSGPPSLNLDLITSDQYAQAYLDHLFSDEGPVAQLEDYLIKSKDVLQKRSAHRGCENKTGVRHRSGRGDGAPLNDGGASLDAGADEKRDETESRGREEKTEEPERRDGNVKLSVDESQLDERLEETTGKSDSLLMQSKVAVPSCLDDRRQE
ncbi:uncharacterized protein [Brachionichthys hirsutus]|uniref:uncharacterized protein isoform X2 n=1 Tax=Brachionichthys hirsutus TaxID=412623 RepID=UPI00360499B0